MRAFVFLTLLAVALAQQDFYLCEVPVPNFCASPALSRQSNCLSAPALTLKGVSYSLTDNFNVISFADFNAPSSDTEGRIAVRNNAHMSPDAYSVGALIYTKGVGATDMVLPYSAVIGGDCNWVTGECFPVGNDYPTSAYAEQLFVGGSFTTTLSSLQSRRDTAGAAAHSNDADFDNAQAFYTALQAYFDAIPNTITISAIFSTLQITCTDGSMSYNGHVSTSDFNSVTGYSLNNCDATIPMIITIGTASDTATVQFSGGSWDATQRKPERTVFNVLGNGRTISVSGTQIVANLLAPNNVLAFETGFIQGITIVGNISKSWQFNRVTCVKPAPVPNTPVPCVGFEATCDGTLFTAAGSISSAVTLVSSDTRDFNIISFGNYIANTGDIQGRALVRHNVQLGNGYSIGYTLSTLNNIPDRHETFGLVAGGDCTWGSGALYPDGTNAPNAGQEEYIYCGSSFTSTQGDLQARYKGECGANNAGCLETIFTAAKSCYDGYSASAAAQSDNVAHVVQFDAMTITCNDNTASNYVVSITDVEMTQYTYYVLENCNFQAEWIVNIRGTGDVNFTGDSFPVPAGAALFNVIGSRTVNVNGISINGHLLATNAVLNQVGGVIVGKVVVGDVTMALQINSQSTCQTVTNVTVAVQSGNVGTPAGSYRVAVNTPLADGDILVSDAFAAPAEVISNGNGAAVFDIASVAAIAPNTKVGTVLVRSNTNRANAPITTTTSSASVVSVSVALIALIALL